ncbi:MAG TPA: YceI family protein [Opitutaceae bacterium]
MKRLLPRLAALLVAASAVGAAERPLVVDQVQSQVEIAVRATVDSFTARLVDFRPNILIDPDDVRVTAATLAFRFEDVKTGKAKRDGEMHDWQNTPAYPDGQFVLAALEPAAGGNGSGKGNGHLTARGTLTFHGVSREISFPVAITTDSTVYAIDGEAPVDTRDFGLPIIRKFAVLKVDPVVKVRFHLQGKVGP